MKVIPIFFILFPCCILAQPNLGNDYLSIRNSGPTFVGTIIVDSFKTISNVKCLPQFTVSLDSLAKSIVYPQMEGDNLIGGDTYGMFKVNCKGIIDSAWLSHSIKRGIDKEILRFLRNLTPMFPARKHGKNISCICQLAFHFRVKDYLEEK